MYPADKDEYTCLACGEHLFTDLPFGRAVLPPSIIQEGPRKRGRPRKHPIPVAVAV
jgi:hypothetical protein